MVRGIDNSSVLVGSKVTCFVCRFTSTSYQSGNNFCAVDTYLYLCESCRFDNLGIFTEGNCCYPTSQPSTWGNQRGARIHQAILGTIAGEANKLSAFHQVISGAVAGDSSLQDRGVAHYLLSCFLVLLVYLSVFT